MREITITVDGGTSKRLLTAGKYCDRDIVVTATGGSNKQEDELIRGVCKEYVNDRVTTVGQYAFYRNSAIESVDFQAVTSINQYAFGNCTALVNANFPLVKTLGSYSFQNCSKLKSIEFPSLTTVNTTPFTGCSSLTALILSGSSVCNLKAKTALSGTPIASGDGFVYVRDEMVETYKSDSDWGNYVDKIKPISELGISA